MFFYTTSGEELDFLPQSFSSIDLSLKEGRLGIVFPYDKDTDELDTLCVSSIIDHHDYDKGYLLKHTEIRQAYKEEHTLIYSKIEKATAYVIMNNKNILDGYSENYIINLKNTERINLLNIYKDFEPLFFIDSKNIEEKHYSPLTYFEELDDRFNHIYSYKLNKTIFKKSKPRRKKWKRKRN